jgi:hypothetical protein
MHPQEDAKTIEGHHLQRIQRLFSLGPLESQTRCDRSYEKLGVSKWKSTRQQTVALL